MAKRARWNQRQTVIDWPARLLLAVVMITANVAGTIGTVVFAVWALPKGPLPDPDRVLLLNLVLVASYLVVVVPLAMLWIALRFRARVDDALQERQLVLHGPL